MTGKSVNVGMKPGSVFAPSYPNSLRLSRKQSQRSRDSGEILPEALLCWSWKNSLFFFFLTEICKRSLKNMKCLKSTNAGHGGFGLRRLMLMDPHVNTLSRLLVIRTRGLVSASLKLGFSCIEQVKLFFPFCPSRVTFDKWFKSLPHLKHKGDTTFSAVLLDEVQLPYVSCWHCVCCLVKHPVFSDLNHVPSTVFLGWPVLISLYLTTTLREVEIIVVPFYERGDRAQGGW